MSDAYVPTLWTSSLTFLTESDRASLALRLPEDQQMVRKHQLMHLLLTDPDIGLIRFATPEFDLWSVLQQSAVLRLRGTEGLDPTAEELSALHSKVQPVINRIRAQLNGLKKDQARLRNLLLIRCAVADALLVVNRRNNHNPTIFKTLVDALLVLEQLSDATQHAFRSKQKDETYLLQVSAKVLKLFPLQPLVAKAA